MSRESNQRSFPSNFRVFQPALANVRTPLHQTPNPKPQTLQQWVPAAKKFKIKEKLQDKFSSAEECFNTLDADGGGSLDRTEVAKGLRGVGIWLHPNELFALLQFLDEDGSGSVEIDELESFWNSVANLPDENLQDTSKYLQGSM